LALMADGSRNEDTTAWCNRDLVPLPPSRRTWGWFNFFGATSLYVDKILRPCPLMEDLLTQILVR
jgi:hypothetical protein